MITRYYVKSVAHCDEQTETVVLLDCSFIVSCSSLWQQFHCFVSLSPLLLCHFREQQAAVYSKKGSTNPLYTT